MDKYPEIFPPGSITSELYFKFYGQVCTRCFGWGLPSTSLIPMADNCNHSDVTVVQEIINTSMHLDAEPESPYFTKTKMMNDFQINFKAEDYEGDLTATANIFGRYNKANFDANKQFTSVESVKESIAAGVEIWDVPCIRETYSEDNDTDPEDEGDEEELKDNSKLLDSLSCYLTDRKANMCDLRKGFVFFMD